MVGTNIGKVGAKTMYQHREYKKQIIAHEDGYKKLIGISLISVTKYLSQTTENS